MPNRSSAARRERRKWHEAFVEADGNHMSDLSMQDWRAAKGQERYLRRAARESWDEDHPGEDYPEAIQRRDCPPRAPQTPRDAAASAASGWSAQPQQLPPPPPPLPPPPPPRTPQYHRLAPWARPAPASEEAKKEIADDKNSQKFSEVKKEIADKKNYPKFPEWLGKQRSEDSDDESDQKRGKMSTEEAPVDEKDIRIYHDLLMTK